MMAGSEKRSQILFLALLAAGVAITLAAAITYSIWLIVTAAVLVGGAALVSLIRQPRQVFYVVQYLFWVVFLFAWSFLWTAKGAIERYRAMIAVAIAVIGSQLMNQMTRRTEQKSGGAG